MTEELFEERRRLKRRHLVYYLKVFDLSRGELIGHLVDITSEGFMLVREEPLETGKVFHFRLELPQEILMKETITFTAECRWTRRDVNPDLFVSGFFILEIEDEDMAVIDSLIRRHGFQD